MTTKTLSKKGLALIKAFEGFQPKPRALDGGGWLVGYGHVRVGEAGAALSREEAEAMLALDLAPVEASVNERVTRTLSQAQFDALVSFAFSIGVEAFARSQVLRRVNAGDMIAAACAMDAWRKSEVGGELEVAPALVRRRAAEKAMFLREAVPTAAPSALMRAQIDHAVSILGAPSKVVTKQPAPSPAPASLRVEPAARLTEILKSEPATEALLLTRVVTDDDTISEEEIVTAHAKPVPRTLWLAQPAPRDGVVGQLMHKLKLRDPAGAFGLAALMVFGLVLVLVAAAGLFGGPQDLIDVAGAAALAGPGLTAMLTSAYGFWRAPKGSRV